MKKLDKTITIQYLPVVIHKDEIEEICNIFTENNIEYEIYTDKYLFNTKDELFSSGIDDKIKLLEIKARKPYLTIEFRHFYTKLYMSSNEIKDLGLLHELDIVLKKSQRSLSFLYSSYVLYSVMLLFTIVAAFLRKFATISETIYSYSYIVIFFYFIVVTYVRFFTYSTIYLSSKRSKPNFLKRKKDDLILLVIGAILGAILTIITTKLIK